MNISFRDAQKSDLPEIIAMLVDDDLGAGREIAGEEVEDCYLEAFQDIQDDPNQQLIVAVESDTIIGTLQISYIPGLARMGTKRGQIEAVRVASSHRGKGIGGLLFRWAIDKCKQRGCKLVQLTSDKQRKDAHGFYEDLGFEASHEGYKLTLGN